MNLCGLCMTATEDIVETSVFKSITSNVVVSFINTNAAEA